MIDPAEKVAAFSDNPAAADNYTTDQGIRRVPSDPDPGEFDRRLHISSVVMQFTSP
jgi:hypothetical protein